MNWEEIAITLCTVLLSIRIASATPNLTMNEWYLSIIEPPRSRQIYERGRVPEVSNTRVNFTTDYGVLSAGYSYTNASGTAVVNIGVGSLYCEHHTLLIATVYDKTQRMSLRMMKADGG